MDISGWWLVGAFFVGGYMGALLVALITMAASDGGSPAEHMDGHGGLAAKGGGAARWSM